MEIRKSLRGVWVVPIALAIDRLTKLWVSRSLTAPRALIPSVLGLTYARNTGAAFSLLAGKSWIIFTLTGILLVGVLLWLFLGRSLNRAARLGLWLVIAGGAGNLYDRIAYGYVVDFLEPLFMRFAVFNVADICVVCGAILALIALCVSEQTKKQAE